jgi:hypothetical protein
MLNKQELQTIHTLLQRVDLKGSEAMTVAILFQRLQEEINVPLAEQNENNSKRPTDEPVREKKG